MIISIFTKKQNMHKSGFINIIDNPDVGKSTLMNELVGERISITTSGVKINLDITPDNHFI
jgi:predicted GTPase